MLNKTILILSILLFSIASNAQNAVIWGFHITSIEADSNIYEIEFHATIGEKWHLYSQDLPSPDAGPLPTLFEFDENENIELIGKVIEEKDKMHSEMDEAFGVKVNYFDGSVVFRQKIKLKSPYKTAIIGFISYMVCNDSMCVPKDLDFSIPIGSNL